MPSFLKDLPMSFQTAKGRLESLSKKKKEKKKKKEGKWL